MRDAMHLAGMCFAVLCHAMRKEGYGRGSWLVFETGNWASLGQKKLSQPCSGMQVWSLWRA